MSVEKTSLKRPRKAIWGAILVVLAWFAIGGVGGPLVGKLGQVSENDNSRFLPSDAEATVVSEALPSFTDAAEIPYLVVIEKDSALTPGDLGTIQSFASSLATLKLPEMGPERTLGEFLAPKEGPPIAIPAADGKATLIAISLDQKKATATINETNALVEGAAAIRAAAADALGSDLRLNVGGPAGLISDFGAAFAGIDGILLLVTLSVVLVILLIVYRSPILPFIVLVSSIFALGMAALAVYYLAKNGKLALSGQSQGIMSILVIGAATDYALLLVARFREELHDDSNAWGAVRRAWRAVLEPITASAATVAVGLLCLLLASVASTRGLGPVGAFAVLGAFVASLTFLPAVLVLLGRWAFWPFVPKPDHVHSVDAVGSRSIWGRVSGLVGRRPRQVWVITVLLLVAASAFVPTFKAEGIAASDVFLTKVDSVTATEVISKHFPSGSGSPAQVLVPEAAADRALGLLTQDAGVDTAYEGLAPARPGAPAAARVVRDGKVLLQATLKDASDSRAAEDTVKRLRTTLDAASPEAAVGGVTATNIDLKAANVRDLLLIVPVVLGLIFVVLCLLLRSIIAPLVLVVANILSFGATLGVSAIVFNHVLKFPGGDASVPLYAFVFLVALGIDYSIFLMTRVREESIKRGTRPGILVGLAVTGGVITSAGIVLAATFSALTVIPLVFMVQIAFTVALGVLIDTFIVRSLLVPAMSHDIGERVWWPSALARRSS